MKTQTNIVRYCSPRWYETIFTLVICEHFKSHFSFYKVFFMKRSLWKKTSSETRQLTLLLRTDKVDKRECEKCRRRTFFTQPSLISRFFKLTEREIFRTIENNRAHSFEDMAGQLLVCIECLVRQYPLEGIGIEGQRIKLIGEIIDAKGLRDTGR